MLVLHGLCLGHHSSETFPVMLQFSRGLVSEEILVLRRWGVESNAWFVNRVDNEGKLATVKRFEC